MLLKCPLTFVTQVHNPILFSFLGFSKPSKDNSPDDFSDSESIPFSLKGPIIFLSKRELGEFVLDQSDGFQVIFISLKMY